MNIKINRIFLSVLALCLCLVPSLTAIAHQPDHLSHRPGVSGYFKKLSRSKVTLIAGALATAGAIFPALVMNWS